MTPQTALIVGLFAPLVTCFLVPFLAVRANWRDLAGPVGAVITFIAAIEVARDVLAGGTPSWILAELAPGIELGFRVTPLGAIFGLVASG
ncbi:MAG: monovalent cation/H+ antiporter subunit D family protein, partial [SAR116 cluster bacterium]|nr:monovalent cation/H+ antiporter subunit D family protein [SAR116 cluster bacterium]